MNVHINYMRDFVRMKILVQQKEWGSEILIRKLFLFFFFLFNIWSETLYGSQAVGHTVNSKIYRSDSFGTLSVVFGAT